MTGHQITPRQGYKSMAQSANRNWVQGSAELTRQAARERISSLKRVSRKMNSEDPISESDGSSDESEPELPLHDGVLPTDMENTAFIESHKEHMARYDCLKNELKLDRETEAEVVADKPTTRAIRELLEAQAIHDLQSKATFNSFASLAKLSLVVLAGDVDNRSDSVTNVRGYLDS